MIGAQGTEALGAAGMTNLVINLSVSLLMGLMLLPTTSVAAAHAKNDPAKVLSCRPIAATSPSPTNVELALVR